jgi:DNA-binding transcriptional MerR regulator
VFTTGEFSKIARVTRKTLRHYRETGLFAPAERGAESGYHIYTMAQLPRLQRILALRDLGFGLEQIQHMVDDAAEPGQLREMLEARKAEIKESLAAEEKRIRVIESRLRLLEIGVANYEVVVKPLAAAPYFSATFRVESPEEAQAQTAEIFRELPRFVDPSVRGKFVSRMRADAHETHGVDLELGCVLQKGADLGPATLAGVHFDVSELVPSGTAATILMNATPDLWHMGTTAIGYWMESNRQRIADLPRELWHELPAGPGAPPVVELQWPVEPLP